MPLIPQHQLTQDLEFEGYYFPAGTEFLMNSFQLPMMAMAWMLSGPSAGWTAVRPVSSRDCGSSVVEGGFALDANLLRRNCLWRLQDCCNVLIMVL